MNTIKKLESSDKNTNNLKSPNNTGIQKHPVLKFYDLKDFSHEPSILIEVREYVCEYVYMCVS